jgi:hypothetical protein
MVDDELQCLLSHLTAEEQGELDALLTVGKPWVPLPGPQTLAYQSEADVIGYGGSAGGGRQIWLWGWR